jgi:hypothetical protein
MQGLISNADGPVSAQYGFPEEWAAFSETHQEFLKRFKNIERGIAVAFQRVHQTNTPLEKVIYFQGRLIVEDFSEILLLCGNGYGIGAHKLVRGMYERAVTARYLMEHPDEIDNFLDYHRVSDYKFLMVAEQSTGRSSFSPDQVKKIKEDYESVKSQFVVSDCKTCGTTRPNHTWTKVDIVAMARMTKNLWPFVLPGYYIPMREGHSTVGAIFSRLDPVTEDGLVFGGDAQRDRANMALFTAHMILIESFQLQREFFKIEELDSVIQTCISDYSEIWKDKAPSTE